MTECTNVVVETVVLELEKMLLDLENEVKTLKGQDPM
jgi:hypothetical protein